MEALSHFPGAVLLLGILVAGIIFYVANRRVFIWMGSATELLRTTLLSQIAEITKERDDYRIKLHEEKGLHQVTVNALTEARSRPDVNTIHTLLTEQSSVLREIFTSFQSHKSDDSKVFKEITHALVRISEKLDHRETE